MTRAGNGIRGRIVGPEPKDELDHFYRCETCGQNVDMRELEQVIYHEQPDHQPMPRD